ncbi:MAG: Uma2 family endonuclease [Acidobacteriota bacterium]
MDIQYKTDTLTVPPPKPRGSDIFYPDSDGEPMAETDLHANLLMNLRMNLDIFFAEREDVYVSGNLMFYYVEGDPTQVISPDVMVCFGIPKGNRTSYKTWEEKDVVPSVVIELSSRGTWRKDFMEKKTLYEVLGVKEYYIFNPLEPKTAPAFTAYELKNGEFTAVKIENNCIKSEILGLDLIVEGKNLRLFDPATNQFLKTAEELAETVGELSETVGELSTENDFLKAENERLKKLLEKQ